MTECVLVRVGARMCMYLNIPCTRFQLQQLQFFRLSTFAESDMFPPKSNLAPKSDLKERTLRLRTIPAAASKTTSRLRARRCDCAVESDQRE
jgi:hypothetical protein